jgi:RNase P subunit RPR2
MEARKPTATIQNCPALKAARNDKTKEVAMTTVASMRGSAHETICDKCGEALIAPEWAEYFSEEGVVLNLWSCTRCGNRFETEALAPPDADSKLDRQVLEEFFPSLLVA